MNQDTKKMMNELENDFTKGNDEYPSTMNEAYSMLYYRVDDPPRIRSKSKWREHKAINIFNTEEIDEEDDRFNFLLQIN